MAQLTLSLTQQAREDLDYWDRSDPELASRIRTLLLLLKQGLQLPVSQKTDLKFGDISLTSVKIAHEHRLVFEPSDNHILLHQCRFHY